MLISMLTDANVTISPLNDVRDDISISSARPAAVPTSSEDLYDATSSAFDEIFHEHTRYRFRMRMKASFYRKSTTLKGEVSVSPNILAILGRGEDLQAGLKDWSRQFHDKVQRLWGLRDWEQTGEDRKSLRQIEEVLNMYYYNTENLIVTREIGIITRSHTNFFHVKWETGESNEIHKQIGGAEFSKFRSPMRFEADIHKDPVTNKILRLSNVERLKSLSQSKLDDDLLKKFRSSTDEPDSDWNYLCD